MTNKPAVMAGLLLAAATLVAPQVAPAQDAIKDYPNRVVSLVVPYPPGGGVDVMARVVAEKLTGILGHTVIVDNRPGGSGLVGTRSVIKAAPDGYTLFLGHTGSISINPTLYANANFDPRTDLTAIGLMASMPVALLAHPSFPGKSLSDVIEIGKKEKGALNIGTSAVGTGGYMTAELFKSLTGVQAQIVPYKGTGQLMNDLVGGHVPIAFGVLPPAMGNLAAGVLKGIAMIDSRRFSLLPEIPTSVEPGQCRASRSVAALWRARSGWHAASDRRQAQRGNPRACHER